MNSKINSSAPAVNPRKETSEACPKAEQQLVSNKPPQVITELDSPDEKPLRLHPVWAALWGPPDPLQPHLEVIQPLQKKRIETFNQMNNDWQTAALTCQLAYWKLARGMILTAWDVGDEVAKLRDDAKLDPNVVGRLAAYLGKSQQELHDAQAIAMAFDRDFLMNEIVTKQMAQGSFLTVGHLLVLAPIRSKKDRQKMLEQCCNEALTVKQLAIEVENRFFKHNRPTATGSKPSKAKNRAPARRVAARRKRTGK